MKQVLLLVCHVIPVFSWLCDGSNCELAIENTFGFSWSPEARAKAVPMNRTGMGPDMVGGSADPPCPAPRAVDNYLENPASHMGALYFTVGTESYRCSAQVIVGNPSVVLTGGHCCSSVKDKYFKNFEFVRKKGIGAATHMEETFTMERAYVKSWWLNDDTKYEFDFCFLKSSSSGPNPNGGIGYIVHNDPDVMRTAGDIHAYGYAENWGEGKYNYYATGPVLYIEKDKAPDGRSCGIFSMNCNPLHGGSSGGGWLQELDGQWYLIGLNSFYNKDKFDEEYSPIVGYAWYDLCHAAGGCNSASEATEQGSLNATSAPAMQLV